MDKRIELRPKVESAKVLDLTSELEQFQNETLRPVIKLQHSIMLIFVRETIHNINATFPEISRGKQENFLKSLFAKDIAFKNKLIGLVIGQFTDDEMSFYLNDVANTNKRILNICNERMRTHLNELVKS